MNSRSQLTLVVLAAGKGTRMKSDKAKVLHEVFSAPMVHHVLRATQPLTPSSTIVIVGHQRDVVTESLTPFDVTTVTQEEQLGTGHAVAIAEDTIPVDSDTIMILCGDTPLIRPETLQEMYRVHSENNSELTVMTTILDTPTNYGRIITDSNDNVLGIVEEKDASAYQKSIKEINAGIYCVNREFLFRALKQVDTDNSQGEVYLTDIVGIAVKAGKSVEKYATPFSQDVLGVNSRVELAQAHSELQYRRNVEVLLQGVTIQRPESVSISPCSRVGKDTLIMQGVHILDKSSIGERCILEPGAIVHNCVIGNSVTVGAYSVLRNCNISEGTAIPPHSTSA